jgi:TatD DNase family protein
MPIQFFDSHCHFDFAEFDSLRHDLWHECHVKGIQQLLIPGTAPLQWAKAYDITQNIQGIVMAAGIHPWWSVSPDLPDMSSWADMLARDTCVAIGECGLDARIDTPLDLQGHIFERHLQLSVDMSMPLIIHVRDTHNDTIRLLKKYRPPKGGVIHGFTGSQELAMQYWQMGFYLGVGGSITYPRALKTRKTLASMPLESLLLETDAPDMPLFGHQGVPNTPLQIVTVAQTLAELRGDSIENVAMMTHANSGHLFGV